MKDLDFDELDRAVNSLVSQAKGGRAASPAPERTEPAKPEAQPERPVAVKSTPAASTAAPTSDDIVPVAQKSTTTAPAITSPTRTRLGAKRPGASPGRGSFIDIVAPKATAPVPKVSRTSSVIQPVSKPDELKTEPPKSEKTPVEEPAEVAVEPPTPTEPVESVAVKPSTEEEWPDPLDFHDDDGKVVAEAAKSAEEPQQDKKPGTPKWQQPSESGTSPFIPGAKVEKRPLGAFAPSEAEAEKPAEPASSAESADMPDELKPEVLAAESNQLADHALDEVENEPEKPVEEEVTEPEKPAEPKAEQQVRESALQSIPQQYKTPAKEVSDAPRPVFDTKEYHPPLLEATAHSAHRSPWGKLFIALLIVAVLAVGGYFAFIYFVQNF